MNFKGDKVQRIAPAGERGLVGEPETRFPLGPLENFMRMTHDEFDGDGTVAVVAKVRGRIEEEPLLQVLTMLQHRHPKLRTRIAVNAKGEPWFEVFESLREIPLVIKDFDMPDLPWQREALESCAVKFTHPTEPLWRIQALRSTLNPVSVIICAIHHACGDGVSAFRFLRELFAHYKSLTGDAEAGGLTSEEFAPLPFVSFSRVPITAPLIHRLMTTARLIRGQMWQRRGAWSALPQEKGEPPFWRRHVLSAEETGILAQRCRQEQTTVYGALFAAALRSLSKAVGEPRASFRIGCAISIRKFLDGVSDEHLGCFNSLFDKVYPASLATPFWDLARRGRLDLKRFMDLQGPAMAVNLIRFKKVSVQERPDKRGTLGLNYSVAPLRKTYGNLTVEELSFLGRNRIVGPSLNLFGIKFAGRLNLTLGAVELPRDFRETFLHTLLAELTTAID
jgi:hypothetical protein